MSASTSPLSGDAVEEFYKTQFAEAVGWAAALTGNSEEARDIAQNVILRVATELNQIEDPVAYLHRSVINACRNWHRDNARRRARLSLVAVRDVPKVDEDSIEILELLAVLPYRQRATLVLREWAGWTDTEIAHALRCRTSTVRVLAHRALKRLRREAARHEGAKR